MTTHTDRNPNGGPAFPRPYSEDPTGTHRSNPQKGMSAALWIAGHAMALCDDGTPEQIATQAHDIATAVLDEHYRRYGF